MSQHGCPERLSNRPKGFEDGPTQPTMEVLVETLTGTAFEMTVSPSDTIFAIKSKIFRVEGIPVSQQHLLYNLKELDDASSLRELCIADGARLRLVLGLRGGPISTRRLPPPPAADAHWRDIERLLDSSRDDVSWGSGAAAGGCKVTVLVFRDGERYNMLRVRENDDGSYSPIDHAKSESSSLKSLLEAGCDEGDGLSGSVHENAVTMGKMLELRRRMESLSVTRRRATPIGDKPETIQKTRSEETLSTPRLTDRAAFAFGATLYDCDRYALLPPLATDRTPAASDDRLALPEGLPGSLLFADDDDALCLEPDGQLAPLPQADYGPLVVGGGSGSWRVRGFGSSSQLAPAAPLGDALLSASTSDLEHLTRNRLLPALQRHRNREHLHLSDEGLDRPRPRNLEVGSERRQLRIKKIAEMEGASRSLFEEPSPVRAGAADPTSDIKPVPLPPLSPLSPLEPPAVNKKVRVRCLLCRKRLNIATQHTCRCGGRFCAPHRYAEAHGCAFDYKANAHRYLQRENPQVTAPKLPKI